MARLPQQPFEEPFRVRVVGSKIFIGHGSRLQRALSITQLPNERSSPSALTNIQIGLPAPIENDSAAHCWLLRAWLEDCDMNHAKCCRQSDTDSLRPATFPSRLVEVGRSHLQLVETRTIHSNDSTPLRYLALSYPWGKKEDHQHYFTTNDNLGQHEAGISFDVLPRLFQDAIQLTRSLGIEYLWIDALCIIQGEGGNFKEEARRMEMVFSAAYCVIAASRCKGVSHTFLNARTPRPSIKLPVSGLQIGEDIDNFQQDVIDGHLNTRGWILQERALARRTIYFTENQTYWECGEGIRCETFTKMYNKRAAFLGDPNFPQIAQEDSKGGRIRLFQSLYEQYSQLAFSVPSDRSVAIAGLEQRLIRAFETSGGFGIFERYFGRSMLWRRAPGVDRLVKIDFPSAQEPIPSWSWMGYEGAITFLDLPFDAVYWTIGEEVYSPWTKTTQLGSQNTNTCLEAVPRRLQTDLDLDRDETCSVVWDERAVSPDQTSCVVVAKLKAGSGLPEQKHWVLLVRKSNRTDLYERVGVGCLPKDRIAFSTEQMHALIR